MLPFFDKSSHPVASCFILYSLILAVFVAVVSLLALCPAQNQIHYERIEPKETFWWGQGILQQIMAWRWPKLYPHHQERKYGYFIQLQTSTAEVETKAMDWIQEKWMDKIDFILWTSRVKKLEQPTPNRHGHRALNDYHRYDPAFIPVFNSSSSHHSILLGRDETCHRIDANSRLRILIFEASFCNDAVLTWLDQELQQAQHDNMQVYILSDSMDPCDDARQSIIAGYDAGTVLNQELQQDMFAYSDNTPFLRVYRYIAEPWPSIPVSHLLDYKQYIPGNAGHYIEYESSEDEPVPH